MSMHERPILALATVLVAGAAQAGWQDEASSYDQGRLAKIEEARAKGLAEAGAGPDMAVIHAVLDPAPQTASPDSLVGSWRCRTIKLGGLTPDVVYGWFRCRISGKDGDMTFEKLSGSQRLSGKLYAYDPGGFVLLAGLNVKGEPSHRYSGNRPSVGAQATPDDAIGLLSSIGPQRARIEFPYPVQESTFDVIELKR